MEKEMVLEVRDLKKVFDEKEVIQKVSFSVEKGEVFGFLGPNGAGKTTIIRMILGLIKRDTGTVHMNGYSIDDRFEDAIRNVGAIVETPSFYTHLSGYRNLVLTKNLYPHISLQRIDEVLEMVHLSKAKDKKVGQYSLGMKQRLGLARALLQKPTIIFLDEPTNGLDPKGIKEMREMISQLAIEQDITFIITSHILHEIEQVCERVAILREGKIISEGQVKELLSTEDETIQVDTNQADQVKMFLENQSIVKVVRKTDSGVSGTIDKGKSNLLIRQLIQEGFDVDYVIPQHQSLEQLFLELTEGGNDHD